MRAPEVSTVMVDGRALEVARIAGDASRAPVVLLHEGLGSVTMWKDWPGELAAATGRTTIAYSRYGHGASDVLGAPRAVSYMHREGEIVLPALLDALSVQRAVLFGHSDGASIALVAAAAAPSRVAGLVLEAPHVFVEDLSVASIAAAGAAYADGRLRNALARYHRDADATFHGWNGVWLDPAFRAWNIEAYVERVAAPLLVIQGEDDEYGTLAQVDAIARRAPQTERLVLPACGHSPHRDRAPEVLAASAAFIAKLP